MARATLDNYSCNDKKQHSWKEGTVRHNVYRIIGLVLLVCAASACAGDASASDAPPPVPTEDTRPAAPATAVPSTATPTPTPTATPLPEEPTLSLPDVEQFVLAEYLKNNADVADRLSPEIVASTTETVSISDCVWGDSVANTLTEVTYTVTGTTTSTIAATQTASAELGDCLSPAMIDNLLDFIAERSVAVTEIFESVDFSDPRIAAYNDDPEGFSEILTWLDSLGAHALVGSSPPGDREFVSWRLSDVESDVLATMYCVPLDPSYGVYADGVRIAEGPETGEGGTFRFRYDEWRYTPDTEFGWQWSGGNGITWATGCTTEEWLEKGETWQDLDFEPLP